MKTQPTTKKKQIGQILLEAIWLVLFACAFLTILAHLYEKGKKEIELSRTQSVLKGAT